MYLARAGSSGVSTSFHKHADKTELELMIAGFVGLSAISIRTSPVFTPVFV